MGLRAVAIVLDLVKPAVAGRRQLAQRRAARLNEARERCLFRAFDDAAEEAPGREGRPVSMQRTALVDFDLHASGWPRRIGIGGVA